MPKPESQEFVQPAGFESYAPAINCWLSPVEVPPPNVNRNSPET